MVDMEKPFLMKDDIMYLLGVKQAKAYNIIKELNKELLKKKYLVANGRVPTKYFRERYGV